MNGQEYLWMECCFLWMNMMWFQSHIKQILFLLTQFSCPSIQGKPLWNCSSLSQRKTRMQLHQPNVWGSKFWLRGKKKWLEKKLRIIYNLGEKSVLDFFRQAQKLEILYPQDGLTWRLPLHLRKRLINDLGKGNQLAFYGEKKLSICRLKKASRAVLRANPYTSQTLSHRHFAAIHYM